MRARASRALFLCFVIACACSRAAAQTSVAMIDSGAPWRTMSMPASDCMASLPLSAMSKQSIFLDARMAPGTSTMVTDQADLIASDVATELLAILAGSDSISSSAAADIKWYSIPAELIVVARRKGEMTWRGVSESGDSSALRMLSSALDAARRHGHALMIWPEDVHDDSLVIRLALLPDSFREAPLAHPIDRKPRRFGVFVSPSPDPVPPKPRSDVLRPIWPHHPQSERVSGLVVVEFVIDSAGKPVMSTFRDIWPVDQPRLRGIAATYYDQFLSTIRSYTSESSYVPAHVGTCKIAAVMRETFDFDGKRDADRYSKWE